MEESLQEQLEEVNREDFIWGIYIFIVAFAILSNQLEKDYIVTHDRKKYKEFHSINTLLFAVGVLIYTYLFLNASRKFQKNRTQKNYLTIVATTLFLAGGFLLLCLEIQGYNVPEEPDII